MKAAYLFALAFSWFVTFTCVPTMLSAPSWFLMAVGVFQASVSIWFTLHCVNKFLNPATKENTTNE